MALPVLSRTWVPNNLPNFVTHGIVVGVYPSTQRGLSIEVQSATANSTLSSKWTPAALPPSSGTTATLYRFIVPLSTRRYYFRARSFGAGFTASTYTPVVSALPTTLPVIVPFPTIYPSLNAAGNIETPGANVLISSGNAPKVGSQNTSSFVRKIIRIPGVQFRPASTNFHLNSTAGQWVKNASVSATTQISMAPVVMPPKTRLKTMTMRYWRKGSSANVNVTFHAGNSDIERVLGGASLSATGNTSSWRNKASTLITATTIGTTSYQFTTADVNWLQLKLLTKGAANTSDARLQYVELAYDMPDYKAGL